MTWKENPKPHLSRNIGSEQRGDRAVRVREGGGRLGGPLRRSLCEDEGLDVSTALIPTLARPRERPEAARTGVLCVSFSLSLQRVLAQDLSKGQLKRWGVARDGAVPGHTPHVTSHRVCTGTGRAGWAGALPPRLTQAGRCQLLSPFGRCHPILRRDSSSHQSRAPTFFIEERESNQAGYTSSWCFLTEIKGDCDTWLSVPISLRVD